MASMSLCRACQRQIRLSSTSSSSSRLVASSPRPPLRRSPSTSSAKRTSSNPLPPRELPPIKSRTPLYAAAAIAAIGTWSAFVYYATHSERANSSVFRSLTFQLRTNERVRELLGDRVRPAELLPGFTQVHGSVNMLSGKVDIQFRVHGDQAAGTASFTSIRRDKGDKFEILRWRIVRDDGVVLDLANDDPRTSRTLSLVEGESSSSSRMV